MKGKDLLDHFDLVKEEYIEAADRPPVKRKKTWLPWVAAAACFCLILGAALWLGGGSEPPVVSPTQPTVLSLPTEPTQPSEATVTAPTAELSEPWELHFNKTDLAVDAARRFDCCIFYEALELDTIQDLLPENCPEVSGASALFNSTGEFLALTLQIDSATVELSYMEPLGCYVLPGEGQRSEYKGVSFLAFQYEWGERVTLSAEAELSGIFMSFTTECAAEALEQTKAEFQALLEVFASYEQAPELRSIRPSEIPLLENRSLSAAEAILDPDFGQYFLQNLPTGFAEESIRKYRDQQSFYLSGLWTKGLDTLSWRISYFTETDAARVTSVADLENYDLSLYPIPRADSVPEELREIVNDPIFLAGELTLDAVYARAYRISDSGDTDGWRMQFTVRYGDYLISVNAKGIDPQWLYQQLQNFKNN